MEHLYDIMALQINNFNSFFNSCNNLQGQSRRDNILWMIVTSKTHLPYIIIIIIIYLYSKNLKTNGTIKIYIYDYNYGCQVVVVTL